MESGHHYQADVLQRNLQPCRFLPALALCELRRQLSVHLWYSLIHACGDAHARSSAARGPEHVSQERYSAQVPIRVKPGQCRRVDQ